jgi:hypothetical protein
VILLIRGERVILDADLAVLYGLPTKALLQALRRNLDRFPPDFAFQLSEQEVALLEGIRPRIARAEKRGGRRSRPYAFTEHGVAMLSSVLRSPAAVRVNIEIMRAFVRLRRLLASHQELARKLDEFEQKYDGQFRVVFDAIRRLMTPTPVPAQRRIGFSPEDQGPAGSEV